MAIVFVRCPRCRQKLALMPYVNEGTLVVCANPDCGTSLRLIQRKPPKVEEVPEQDTRVPDYRPESYG